MCMSYRYTYTPLSHKKGWASSKCYSVAESLDGGWKKPDTKTSVIWLTCELSGKGRAIATENGLVVSRRSGIAYGELIDKWSQFLFRLWKSFGDKVAMVTEQCEYAHSSLNMVEMADFIMGIFTTVKKKIKIFCKKNLPFNVLQFYASSKLKCRNEENIFCKCCWVISLFCGDGLCGFWCREYWTMTSCLKLVLKLATLEHIRSLIKISNSSFSSIFFFLFELLTSGLAKQN